MGISDSTVFFGGGLLWRFRPTGGKVLPPMMARVKAKKARRGAIAGVKGWNFPWLFSCQCDQDHHNKVWFGYTPVSFSTPTKTVVEHDVARWVLAENDWDWIAILKFRLPTVVAEVFHSSQGGYKWNVADICRYSNEIEHIAMRLNYSTSTCSNLPRIMKQIETVWTYMNVTCILYTFASESPTLFPFFLSKAWWWDQSVRRTARQSVGLFTFCCLFFRFAAQCPGRWSIGNLPKPPSWKLFCLLNLGDMFERIESGKSEESCIATLRGFNVSICELSAAFRLVCLFHDYF